MKMKWLTIVAAAFITLSVSAENLLINGELNQLRGTRATAWSKVGKLQITYLKNGIKENTGSALFVSNEPGTTGSIRQNLSKKVLPGKSYRLSASFKGENFKAADYGFLLINTNWKGNTGIRRFRLGNDGKWRTMSKVVTVPANWTSVTAVVFASDLQGKLYVSDIQCVPVEK